MYSNQNNRVSRLVLTLSTAAFCQLPIAASRSAELDGAWTTNKEACNIMFVESGGKRTFSPSPDLYGSGFIIDGKSIRGKAANCTIKSMKRQSDRFHILAACATDIMLSDTQFDLTFKGDGRLTRSFRGMPEMSLDYFRCTDAR
jgi:hypothetical protein